MPRVIEGAANNNISLFSARQTFQLCYISMHIKVTDKQTNEQGCKFLKKLVLHQEGRVGVGGSGGVLQDNLVSSTELIM